MAYFENLKLKHQLHSAQRHEVGRHWQAQGATTFSPKDFILPLFILNDDDASKPSPGFPGINLMGINQTIKYLKPLVDLGLSTILLFPSLEIERSLNIAFSKIENPLIRAPSKLKTAFPNLQLMADVCLCTFNETGHCCVYDDKKEIDFPVTVKLLADLALVYAKAGYDIVAPSDMMDGRIGYLRGELNAKQCSQVSIMAYAAKFSSCLYGPFRGAAGSKPNFGNRDAYQLPIGSSGLAMQAVNRDVEEGADVLMVKPASLYLDIVASIRARHPSVPISVYHVSGEYTTLLAAVEKQVYDRKSIIWETMVSFKRAGASVIITYFTPELLKYIREGSF